MILILVAFFLFGLCGCATDNEFLLKHSCLFSRRSDKIPGLLSPRDRSKAIQDKAKNVAEGSPQDRAIVVGQLVEEYRNSSDPNLRKEAVAGLAKIPHPERANHLKAALADENVNVRIAACRGLVRNMADSEGLPGDTEHTLRHLVVADPDKDVRLTSIQSLRKAGRKCSPETLDVLEQCLNDKELAVRYEAMSTLAVCTGKDFGPNVDRWLAYFQHKRGDTPVAPAERSLAERMPRPEWAMFR